jgi:hypothetical protein
MTGFNQPQDIWGHIDIAMVRPRADYVSHTHWCVQLGAGNKRINHWDNIDYPVFDADKELPYPDSTINAFASYHTLDHLHQRTQRDSTGTETWRDFHQHCAALQFATS